MAADKFSFKMDFLQKIEKTVTKRETTVKLTESNGFKLQLGTVNSKTSLWSWSSDSSNLVTSMDKWSVGAPGPAKLEVPSPSPMWGIKKNVIGMKAVQKTGNVLPWEGFSTEVCMLCGLSHKKTDGSHYICFGCRRCTDVFCEKCNVCLMQTEVVCTVCHKVGHTMANCLEQWRRIYTGTYDTMEAPVSMEPTPKFVDCCICGKSDHPWYKCPYVESDEDFEKKKSVMRPSKFDSDGDDGPSTSPVSSSESLGSVSQPEAESPNPQPSVIYRPLEAMPPRKSFLPIPVQIPGITQPVPMELFYFFDTDKGAKFVADAVAAHNVQLDPNNQTPDSLQVCGRHSDVIAFRRTIDAKRKELEAGIAKFREDYIAAVPRNVGDLKRFLRSSLVQLEGSIGRVKELTRSISLWQRIGGNYAKHLTAGSRRLLNMILVGQAALECGDFHVNELFGALEYLVQEMRDEATVPDFIRLTVFRHWVPVFTSYEYDNYNMLIERYYEMERNGEILKVVFDPYIIGKLEAAAGH